MKKIVIIEIGSNAHKGIIKSLEKGLPFFHDSVPQRIVNYNIEGKNSIRLVIEPLNTIVMSDNGMHRMD